MVTCRKGCEQLMKSIKAVFLQTAPYIAREVSYNSLIKLIAVWDAVGNKNNEYNTCLSILYIWIHTSFSASHRHVSTCYWYAWLSLCPWQGKLICTVLCNIKEVKYFPCIEDSKALRLHTCILHTYLCRSMDIECSWIDFEIHLACCLNTQEKLPINLNQTANKQDTSFLFSTSDCIIAINGPQALFLTFGKFLFYPPTSINSVCEGFSHQVNHNVECATSG